jgi:prepilin-type N-terminal cleavage/methylation domain-containing protein
MMKNVRTRKGRNGFTLLELLIAVSLLAIGLLAVASMQSVAMNANMVSNRLTVATTLAQQVAEDMLSWNISDPRLNSPSMPAATAPNYIFTNPSTGVSLGTQIYIPGAGTYSARYSAEPNITITGNTRLVIIVSYLSGNASPKDLVTHIFYKRVN